MISLRRLLIVTLVLAGLAAASLAVLDRYYEAHLPGLSSFSEYQAFAPQVSRVYDAAGQPISEFFIERRTVVGPSALPLFLKQAAVAAEDHDFYEHEGLDYSAIIRAAFVNLSDGKITQGASTITQQVARALFLSAEKTLDRKLVEAFLARKLERGLTKDELLTIYLNHIYFGHGRYGVQEAARYYLDKDAKALTVGDAALLMSLVPSPEHRNPFTDPVGARKRRDVLLNTMERLGFLNLPQLAQAQSEPLRLATPSQPNSEWSYWFVDAVRRRTETALGRAALNRGGLHIYTSLRPKAQRAALAAVTEQLGPSAPDAPEAAVVMLDARSREIVALVGGRDPKTSQFNRAIMAKRQAGSTFKPFVYGAGLESGRLKPETSYPNRRIRYRGANGGWRPSNYDGKHDGKSTSVRDALARSLNVVAVQALRDVGIAQLTDFARRAGLNSPIPADLSAALGSATVSPLEITNAYATFASGGLAGTPVLIRRIEDHEGRLLHSESARLHRVIDLSVVNTLDELLRDVVKRGTGKRAQVPNATIAGKTGTTSHHIDAWFVGYSSNIVAGVWLGHDRPRSLEGASGGATAAPIFARALSEWRDSRAAQLDL